MEKKRGRGRPRKEGMIKWHLSVEEVEKNKIVKELKRLKISDSEHVMNVLGLFDLSKLKDIRDYEKEIFGYRSAEKEGGQPKSKKCLLIFFDF